MRRMQCIAVGLLLAGTIVLASPTIASALELSGSLVEVGPGEALVKVHTLPRSRELALPDGRPIDLGYRFGADGGVWVAYVGDPSAYLPLTAEQVDEVVQLAGLPALPPVPARPQTTKSDPGGIGFSFDAIWLLLILGGLGFGAWRFSQRLSTERLKTARRSLDDAADATITALSAGTPRPPRAKGVINPQPVQTPPARAFGQPTQARPGARFAASRAAADASAFGRRG